MATGGNEVTSDEIFNFLCTACSKRNKNREALKYCAECQGYCCQGCVEAHEDFPALVNHNLLDKSSFKLGLKTELPVVPTERCGVHETKILDMYCKNHDDVGCTTCMALDHRNCKDIQSIPDAIDSLFQKSDVGKTYQSLKEKQTVMSSIKNLRDELLQELQTSKAEAIDLIKEFRKEVEQMLENMEKESLKEVEKIFGKVESVLKHEHQTAEEEEYALQKARNDLQKAEGNRAQAFVSMKVAQRKTKNTESIARSLETPPYAKLSFSVNQEIINYLQQRKLFGSVLSRPYSSSSPRKTAYTVKGTRVINIRTQNDSDICGVYGSCLTQYGMLLLAEFNNTKLKRVDMVTMSLLDQCNLPNAPWDVCCVSKQEAAVTLSNKTIQFISLGSQMACTRKLKLNHYCFGIAYKDDRLYITDNDRSLFVHDMTGNMLQAVTKDSSGNDLFQQSRHIAFSDNGDKVFIVDYRYYNGVVVIDVNGKYIERISDQNLKICYSVCTDNNGNIFVCGNASHNVVQMSQDGRGKYGKVIETSNGICYPNSVTFDTYNCVLVVTTRSSDKIKLFDLQ